MHSFGDKYQTIKLFIWFTIILLKLISIPDSKTPLSDLNGSASWNKTKPVWFRVLYSVAVCTLCIKACALRKREREMRLHTMHEGLLAEWEESGWRVCVGLMMALGGEKKEMKSL